MNRIPPRDYFGSMVQPKHIALKVQNHVPSVSGDEGNDDVFFENRPLSSIATKQSDGCKSIPGMHPLQDGAASSITTRIRSTGSSYKQQGQLHQMHDCTAEYPTLPPDKVCSLIKETCEEVGLPFRIDNKGLIIEIGDGSYLKENEFTTIEDIKKMKPIVRYYTMRMLGYNLIEPAFKELLKNDFIFDISFNGKDCSYELFISFIHIDDLYKYLEYSRPAKIQTIEQRPEINHINNLLIVGWEGIVFVDKSVEFLYTSGIGCCISLVLHSRSKGYTFFTHLNGGHFDDMLSTSYDFCLNHGMNDMEATIIGGQIEFLSIKGDYLGLRQFLKKKSIPIAYQFIGDYDVTERKPEYLFNTRTASPLFFKSDNCNRLNQEELQKRFKESGISVSFYSGDFIQDGIIENYVSENSLCHRESSLMSTVIGCN